MATMHENEISGVIIDTAIEIHRKLGPGLLESVYQAVLAHELAERGLRAQREVAIPVQWDGVRLDVGFRADLIVEGKVLVELKSIESVLPVHKKTVLTLAPARQAARAPDQLRNIAAQGRCSPSRERP
jgi:GxxExxY protein